jgi:hypothetical protein
MVCALFVTGVGLVGGLASPNLTYTQLNLHGFSEYVPVDLMAGFKQATGWCAGLWRRCWW